MILRCALILFWWLLAGLDQVETASLPIEAIYRHASPGGGEFFSTRSSERADNSPAGPMTIAFRAVLTKDWIPGLVPVYVRKAGDEFVLSRRPRAGHENTTEPLFFALPSLSETNATRLAGRWECEGTHVDGAKDFFAWDLTMAGEDVVGRFDQNTDYRFAYLTGGSFQSNELVLHIDYISNRYKVTGQYFNGALSGHWQQTSGADRGTWKGTRRNEEIEHTMPPGAVPLYEWHHKNLPTRRFYSIDPPASPQEWMRQSNPICLVWPP